MSHIVIIGAGLAGYTLATEYRKYNQQTQLTIISKCNADYYHKPQLSTAFANDRDVAAIISATAAEMSARLNAKILTQTQVLNIDAKAGKITVSNQAEPIAYDKCVLAVGASVHTLSGIQGFGEDILSINHIMDYAILRKQLENTKNIAVIGSGLIGIELAHDLTTGGYAVTVISDTPTPLARFLPEPVGNAVLSALTKRGINWLTTQSIQRFTKTDDGLHHIALSGQPTVTADLVIAAIGLSPNIKLAQQTGLATNYGIVVDAYCQSSDANIFALGDCAEVSGQCLQFIAPLRHCAQALAKTLAGDKTRVDYPVMPVVLKTPKYPVAFVPAAASDANVWKLQGEADTGLSALCYNQHEELVGLALTAGEIKHRGRYLQMMSTVKKVND